MEFTRLQFLVAYMLWVMCWSGQNANGQSVGLVLNGVAHANNSVVTITDIGTDGAALFCTTTYSSCCDSTNPETQWYFPNGSAVLNSDQSGIPIRDLPFYRTRNTPAFVVGSPDPIPSVKLNRHPEGTTTGIFHCTVPDANNVIQSLYVGIYTSTTGAVTATMLVYNETTRSLTCTSTGGPATTVTWRKSGVIITINATYQQTQVVTSTTTGTYETVLTIAQSVSDIFDIYNCTIENARGTSSVIAVTGVGLVLNGVSHANNSVVTITDIGTDGAALFCTTTYSSCCSSANPETQWYFPNRSEVLNSDQSGIPIRDLPFYRTRNTPTFVVGSPDPIPSVKLNRHPEGTATGIFRCTLPDANGVLQSMFVGVYNNNTGTPTATTLVYGDATRSLTCTSTGGPATTVTWRKDGAVITINATYQQTQVVTNAAAGEYETVLTIAQSVTDIFGRYSCTVENIRGTSASIEVTAPSVSVMITPTGTAEVGQSYSLSCSVSGADSLNATSTTYRWYNESSNPRSQVGTTSTYTLNPLRQYHAGQYTCEVTITSPYLDGDLSRSVMQNITVQTPSVTVMITPAGTAEVGQSYSLSCSVSGADSLNATSTAYRWYNESSNPRSQVGTTSTFILNPLRPYHTGQYTCEVTITSPYLDGDLSRSVMQNITVQIPMPALVSVGHSADSSTYAGSQLTLVCNIVLDATLFSVLGDLVVTSVWSDPGSGILSSDSRITVSPASQQGITTTFISTVMFDTLRTSDEGTYTCEATLAPRGPTAGIVTNGVSSATGATPTIQNPTIQLDVSSNTTRLPNVGPYNTFCFTCTATVPQGVVSLKTFTWSRSNGSYTSGMHILTDNGDSILVTSTNLDQPTSTSVLTVQETTAGDYDYACRANLSELSLSNTSDVYTINVTGSTNPVQPQNLMNISTRHDRATVQWSVSYIAYTPETYTVNYGRAMNSLDMSTTATERGDNFTIPSQPFMFSAELTGLAPGVTYYYQVEARNSEGPTLSAVQQFTSNELSPTGPPLDFMVTPEARRMIFSWTLPNALERNGVITGYSLSCTPESGGGSIISMQYAQASSSTLGEFTPATTYNCSIFASNSQGNGPAASRIERTLDASPGAPPLGVMFEYVENFPKMVFFSWQPPPTDQQNGVITRYDIICTPNSGGGELVNGMSDGALNATVGMFTPATQYSCTITASTSAGTGPGNTVTVVTLPAAPENVTLTNISSQLLVRWTIDPPNGMISHYTIYVTRVERGNTLLAYTSTNTEFHIPSGDLDPFELVSVSVSASNSAGEGARSPGVRGRTREEPPGSVGCPSRWTDLTSTIQVNWTTPQSPNGIVLQYYLELTSFNGNTVIATQTVNRSDSLITNFSNRVLEDGVPYTVQIFAENSAGNGTACNVTDFTNELEPPTPSGVTATRASDTVIRVVWQPLSLVEARGHIRYRVMVTSTTANKRKRQATQGERMCTLTSPCEVPANESSVLVGGLDRNTSYSVTVVAVNSENEVGSTSAPMIATGVQPTTNVQPTTETPITVATVAGIVVAFVVVIVILVVIMGAVIGILTARNKRYTFSIQEHAMKDQPVTWSAVAKSDHVDIITSQCEAYVFTNPIVEPDYEVIPWRQPGPEYEIPTTQCPAYVATSQQREKAEEDAYETL